MSGKGQAKRVMKDTLLKYCKTERGIHIELPGANSHPLYLIHFILRDRYDPSLYKGFRLIRYSYLCARLCAHAHVQRMVGPRLRCQWLHRHVTGSRPVGIKIRTAFISLAVDPIMSRRAACNGVFVFVHGTRRPGAFRPMLC